MINDFLDRFTNRICSAQHGAAVDRVAAGSIGMFTLLIEKRYLVRRGN